MGTALPSSSTLRWRRDLSYSSRLIHPSFGLQRQRERLTHFGKKSSQSPYFPGKVWVYLWDKKALYQLSRAAASLALLFMPVGSLCEALPHTQPCAHCKAERLEAKQSQGENNLLLLQPHTPLLTFTGKTFTLRGGKSHPWCLTLALLLAGHPLFSSMPSPVVIMG